MRFQVLFHSPHRGAFHLSLTVLVHYRSLDVFSLGVWSPLLPTELACSVVLRPQRPEVRPLSPTGLSPSLVALSSSLRLEVGFLTPWSGASHPHVAPPTPDSLRPGSHLVPQVWAPPLSLATTRGILSLPRGTKMFQFPRFPSPHLLRAYASASVCDDPGSPGRVPPFGYPRICACWRLHAAFRSLPRPSSASSA
jgi:hypothetical protein